MEEKWQLPRACQTFFDEIVIFYFRHEYPLQRGGTFYSRSNGSGISSIYYSLKHIKTFPIFNYWSTIAPFLYFLLV